MPFIFIVINILLKEFIDFPGNQMGWPFFYLCWFPEVQKKMVEEIKSVCGDDVPRFKVTRVKPRDMDYISLIEEVTLTGGL